MHPCDSDIKMIEIYPSWILTTVLEDGVGILTNKTSSLSLYCFMGGRGESHWLVHLVNVLFPINGEKMFSDIYG